MVWGLLTWIRVRRTRKGGDWERKTDDRAGGRKEMSLLSGGVSAAPWSQVDRLSRKRRRARGPLELKSITDLYHLQVVCPEQVALPL